MLNQLLLLLNTAINRKERGERGERGGRGKKGSKMEIVITQSTEEEEEGELEGDTDYMSGALGLIPTD